MLTSSLSLCLSVTLTLSLSLTHTRTDTHTQAHQGIEVRKTTRKGKEEHSSKPEVEKHYYNFYTPLSMFVMESKATDWIINAGFEHKHGNYLTCLSSR